MTIFTKEEREFAANLGVWLADARKRMGMSQDEFGGVVGVHRNSISRWESGESMPSPYKLAVIKRLVRLDLRVDAGVHSGVESRETAVSR